MHGTTDEAGRTRRESPPRRESNEEAPDEAGGSPDADDIAEKGVEAKNSPTRRKSPQ